MKRSLVVLLTIAVLLFAFAGVAMANAQQDAADRLFDLGFIEGYPDGSFGLDRSITRAEFAKVAVIAAGFEEAAALLQNSPSQFTDVQTNVWYTGWINVAASQGFVKGDPAGTFRPNDQIRASEVVTVILRVLGYNDNLPGAWPTNYLVKAAGLGITSGISFDASGALERGKVFQMLSKALDEDVVEWDASKGVFAVKHDPAKTLLEDALGLEKVTGYVTAIPRVDSSLEDDEIRIDGARYVVKVAADFEWFFGAKVNAYVDDEEVLSINLHGDNTVLFDALEEIESSKMLLVGADRKYDFAANADIVGIFIDGASEAKGDLVGNEYDYAKVVLNKNNRIVFVDAYNWDDFLVVEDVDGYSVYGYGEEVDMEDFTIVKGGKTVKLADLEEGNILFYQTANDGYAEVFNKSASGEITRIFTDRIRVQNKDYKRVNDNLGMPAKYMNEDGDIKSLNTQQLFIDVAEAMQEEGPVTVFVDRFGDMVYLSGDLGNLVTTSSYNFVTAPSRHFVDRGTDKWTLDLLNAQGLEVKYDLKQSDIIGTKKILYNVSNTLIDWATGSPIAAVVQQDDVVEVKVDSDGKVTEVRQLAVNNLVNSDPRFKTSNTFRAGMKIDSDVVVFLAEDYFPGRDVDDMIVTTYGELEFEYINAAKFYNKDGKVVAIVVTESSREDDTTKHLTVATGNPVQVAGKNIWRLGVVVNGAKVSIETKENPTISGTIATGKFLEIEVNDLTGKIDVVRVFEDANARVVNEDVVSNIKTGERRLSIGATEYRLAPDAVVVDATDSYKVISLSNLRSGDTAKAFFVEGSGIWVEVVVRTAKAGSAVTPPSTANYQLSSFTASNATVTGAVYNASANTYVLKITDPGNPAFVTVYATDSLANAADTQLDFTGLGLSTGRTYTVELFEANAPGTILGTWTRFLP